MTRSRLFVIAVLDIEQEFVEERMLEWFIVNPRESQYEVQLRCSWLVCFIIPRPGGRIVALMPLVHVSYYGRILSGSLHPLLSIACCQALQRSPLFKSSAVWSPLVLDQCIAVNSMFLFIILKGCSRNIYLRIADRSRNYLQCARCSLHVDVV